MSTHHIAEQLRPLLKWPGGKEKELKYILPNLPTEIENYYEPFVGGGSVYMAMKAKHYFINDLSSELMLLYKYISTASDEFFSYATAICDAWHNATDFCTTHIALTETYESLRNGTLTESLLPHSIGQYLKETADAVYEVLGSTVTPHKEIFLHELLNNLSRKMIRMHTLEKQRATLPYQDICDNIEAAVKSALYMYYRSLYNDHEMMEQDHALHAALFLFIRNYCYSGMFRYNDQGLFNVPYGGIGYNAKSLSPRLKYFQSDAVLAHFAQTEIYNQDFEPFLRSHTHSPHDFIFLDPPYDSDFSTYAQNKFTHASHERLAKYLINDCKAQWMLVIKHTDFIYSLYNVAGLTIRSFDKQYTVSFMNRNNRKATHLLITNYMAQAQ